MSTCFVIQPFDKGKFDKRYDDVFKPAIEKAGLEPYRVDRDPKVSIPIEEIENNIRNAAVCLADITTDNPNVWFELGFAIASKKNVVLVCSDERTTKFPFDVHHRNIISYSSESPRDFKTLEETITKRIEALLEKERSIESIATMETPIKATEGLASHEIVALAIVMKNRIAPSRRVSPLEIRDDMLRAGHSQIATSLALEGLRRKGMVEVIDEMDINGNVHSEFTMTPMGIEWLMANQDKLALRAEPEDREPTF